MNKTYLRYELSETFGIVASPQSNAVYDSTGNLAISAALHEVAVWNLRQCSLVRLLSPEAESAASKAQVTNLVLSPDGNTVAAGYSSGLVLLFSLNTGATAVTLHGHRSAVTAGRYHSSGALLASGSADTDIVVWDAVAESGLYRLRGHRDGVTDVVFLEGEGSGGGRGCRLRNGLASCSKDTLVKLWDLDTQSCVQTVVGHRGEVWSLDVNASCTRLVTGASDNQLRVWELSAQEGKAASAAAMAVDREEEEESGDGGGGEEDIVAVYMGSVARQGNERAARVRFHSDGPLLGVQGAGKAMEVFRIRNELQAKKKMKRRIKRAKEKASTKAAAAAAAAEGSDAQQTANADGAWAEGGGAATEAGVGGPARGRSSALDRVVAGDELESAVVLRMDHRVRSFDFAPSMTTSNSGSAGSRRGNRERVGARNDADFHSTRVLVSLHNNSMEVWGLDGCCRGGGDEGRASKNVKRSESAVAVSDGETAAAAAATAARMMVLDLQGHRSDVRAVAVSSDGAMVASVSHGLAKAWSSRTRQCVRSTPCGFGLTVAFAPGDRHLLVGTKEGNLQVIDLGSGEMIQDYAAHDKAIWSIDLRPDGKGLVSGSADRQVKFWDFEVANGNLGMVHTRSLKVTDDVLCVRYSRHKQQSKLLLAVALLDSTVKVFHDDSLKFFLSLYGHKLPVMTMDISDDGALLATGSADKTVKIWGLDFGDCHRSLLAHDDSIMSVRFVRGTHYLFTCSKDKTIKHWDADHFDKILTLKGHQSEAWTLEVSPDGSFVLSGGHDRSLRLWRRTEEMVFLEEEREKEMEGLFESELDRDDVAAPGADGFAPPPQGKPEGAEAGDGDGTNRAQAESGPATKRSIESVKAGERLMDALELAELELKLVRADERAAAKAKRKGDPAPPARRPNPVLLNLSPLRYVLRTLQMIKTPELEQALLVLPFSQVESLANFLVKLLAAGLEVELCARCTVFLLRVHQARIVSTGSMVVVLDALRTNLRRQLEASRDVVGRNMAGLRILGRLADQDKNAYLMESGEDHLAKKMRQA
eukprot:g11216.t1